MSGAKSRPRNPWAIAGSIAFPLLLLAALTVIPLYRIETLPKREVVTMLVAPLPPATAAPSAMRFHAPKPTYSPASSVIHAPIQKVQEVPPAPVETIGGVVGEVPGGVLGGVLSDVLSSTHGVPLLSKALDPIPNKRIRIPAQVAEANLIHDVTPQYPAEAGRERIEGTVLLMAAIAKDGTVRDVRVESGLPLLAQAAIDAVKQWRYKPYLLNGEPVEVDCHITINFTLSRS
ncbi:MAG: energy transducer TonB [Acidobacteriaceae bacterium]|nr:energy transducer TonB [Acidobacteriaceae bacterium]